VGHVLEQGQWEVLSFAAIAEQDEVHLIESPLGLRRFQRKVGEALHPKRESLDTLKKIRQTIGEYNFASQYQQNPTPPGGLIVKTEWLKYYEPSELPPRFSLILQSWDTANKSGELNDFSVCTTWGVLDRHYYLLDVFRRRLNFPDLRRAVQEQCEKYDAEIVLIEDKASGTQLIQDLKNEGLCGIKPYEPLPGSDKILRLHAQSAEFENGRVLLPRSAPWLDGYVRELTTFPGSKYDDQVDSTTQALHYLKSNSSLDVWARL
jgi:predicted phage terminase large subunit-like protein